MGGEKGGDSGFTFLTMKKIHTVLKRFFHNENTNIWEGSGCNIIDNEELKKGDEVMFLRRLQRRYFDEMNELTKKVCEDFVVDSCSWSIETCEGMDRPAAGGATTGSESRESGSCVTS